MNRSRLGLLAFLALVLVATSGCVHETTEGNARIYSYDFWIPATIFLGGIVAAPAGWFLRKSSARFGWVLLIGGPVAALLFAPSMWRDRAVVDDQGLSIRSGIWGMTAVHQVPWEGLTMVSVISEEVRGRRGSTETKYYLMCESTSAGSAKVPVNNNVAEAAAIRFIEVASERGIPVVDQISGI